MAKAPSCSALSSRGPARSLADFHTERRAFPPWLTARHGGDVLDGDEPALAGELVDHRERGGDPLRGVDDDRHGGDVAAPLEQPVAVREMVAVETPDAALGGGAADPGRTKPAHDGPVNRVAVALGRLRRVDHQLLPLARSWPGRGGGQEPAVPLADLDALQRSEEHTSELQ